jgi:two-component system chemotaxis response regulator CheY
MQPIAIIQQNNSGNTNPRSRYVMLEKNKPIVLIVDDEPVTQLMVTVMLQRSDFDVITANDGQDALKQLMSKDVDLVITDVNMPKMNGLALLNSLRSDGRYQNLPVIMFTAQGQRAVQSEAITKGATDFLTKPINSHKLTDLVSHHLVPTAS